MHCGTIFIAKLSGRICCFSTIGNTTGATFPNECYSCETTLVVIEPQKGKPCFLLGMNQLMQTLLTFTWSSSHESTFHMQSKDYDMELV